ncbi:MAG: arylsulfatase [Verrucomicrobiales bacterium]|nr:arylsulfatase [Verrucomicrobiales bacterium]
MLPRFLLFLVCASLFGTTVQARQPNVLVILSDDQGWGDLSLNGNTNLETPHIDSIARDGAQFDRFYVCPVCSPTRAEFLTGRYHQRGGVYSTSAGGERLDLDERTIAEVFREAGYRTAAFGKWHNGMQYPYHPNGRGFEEFYGFCSGHWGNYYSPMLDHNGEVVKGNGFVIDDFTDHALAYMEQHRDHPFFLYLPYNTPHSPMQVPDAFWDRFKDKPITLHNREPEKEQDLHLRAALAMCENIDWNVGRLLAKLDELGLSDDTIVLYFSDNGPNGVRWNGDMKGRKGSTDEGGVRSPLVMRWPGKIPAGSTVRVLGAAHDLLPTLTDLAGVDLKNHPDHPLDGVSLKSALLGQPDTSLIERPIFSSWKNKASVRTPRFRLDTDGALFDMKADPGQRTDVSAQHDRETRDLGMSLKAYRETMQTELGTDTRPFLIAHPAQPLTQIPARDGLPHGGITRSNKFPNDSFFTHWTSPEDRITWDAEVVEGGDFEVQLLYTCPPEDIGSTIELSFKDQRMEGQLTEAHASALLGPESDRSPRDESPVQDWHRASLGRIHLEKGTGTLTLRAPSIPGSKVMDFRLLLLKRL